MNNNHEQGMSKHPCFSPEMMQGSEMVMYPEIYYKIQPYIIMACDEMEMYGCCSPNNEMMLCMRDRVCDNLFKVYPEMTQYDMEYPAENQAGTPQVSQFDRRRRRGPFRDFILFLLLAESFRRRRRSWYYY